MDSPARSVDEIPPVRKERIEDLERCLLVANAVALRVGLAESHGAEANRRDPGRGRGGQETVSSERASGHRQGGCRMEVRGKIG